MTTDALTECLAAAYAGRPFVRVLAAGAMADSKRTRGTNVVELQAVADPRSGTAVVVGAVDNLVKGAAGQAIQNANLALGLPGDDGASDGGGLSVSAGVSRASRTRGFRAAGIAAGFKPSGKLDLGLLVLATPGTTAAGLFTTNRVAAAPVVLAPQRLVAERRARCAPSS